MTVNQAAEMVGVTRQHMHKLIKTGKVKAKRHGREWNVSNASALAYKRKREEVQAGM